MLTQVTRKPSTEGWDRFTCWGLSAGSLAGSAIALAAENSERALNSFYKFCMQSTNRRQIANENYWKCFEFLDSPYW